MKIAYTKYAVLAFSIAALSSISLATQASPKGGHNPHSSGSQTHSSNNSSGYSNYRPHRGGGYPSHGYRPHGYKPHGYVHGGYGYYPRHPDYVGYYQPHPVHGINLIPSISANIHLPGFSLNLH